MSGSSWITDRLPAKDDADRAGLVWCTDMDAKVVVTDWREFSFDTSKAWMPRDLPLPYRPPQPDTSLAASIERVDTWNNGFEVVEYDDGILLVDDDTDRILEAARKWDAMANQGKTVQGFDNNDSKYLQGKEIKYRRALRQSLSAWKLMYQLDPNESIKARIDEIESALAESR